MADNNNNGAGWLIAAALIGAAGVAGAKANKKKMNKKEQERLEKERLERERQARIEQERKQREYENSFEGKADKFFNGLGSLIGNFANNLSNDYEEYKQYAYRKTDYQLKEDAKSGSLGKRKAAMEELQRRGYTFNYN